MQGSEDGGGRCQVYLAIEFWGKRLNILKFVMGLGSRRLATACTNQPNKRGHNGIGRVTVWELRGALYLIVLGWSSLEEGENIIK